MSPCALVVLFGSAVPLWQKPEWIGGKRHEVEEDIRLLGVEKQTSVFESDNSLNSTQLVKDIPFSYLNIDPTQKSTLHQTVVVHGEAMFVSLLFQSIKANTANTSCITQSCNAH